MPTIYHRARFSMVGTLSLCPPYGLRTDLLCAQAQFDAQPRQIGTTGKSLLIFRNRVKPGNQKYSAFVLTQITGITPLVSRRLRGVGHRHDAR